MLDPKHLTAFDEATALGIAALWNDAIPLVRHMLDHQIDDIDNGIRLAHECDREDCETHDGVLHRDDDSCPCWGCENGGLLTMATDARHWLDELAANGTAYGFEVTPEALLTLVGDWMYVNGQAPRVRVPAYNLGPAYRLLAELADQAQAKFAAMTSS
ncbi:hypothetical protein QBA35_28935 [Streptomyces bottropensis]|uniref:Uncharacterized protein n=1 Tax=Streptomyces bottropensis TaxID=42235 RepID=A0ABU8AUB3_9ACTN